jgi:5-formyltetrahydrofolate cyclo-ligase
MLRSTAVYKGAKTVKVNPDSPQRYVRYYVLADGKLLIMPTPRLKGGFLLLDPRKIQGSLYKTASAIKGAFRLGIELSLDSLVSKVRKIDLIVEGSVAVDIYGGRLGKGEGYGDKEYDMLSRKGLVNACTPVVTTVHDIQVYDGRLPQDPHDVKVGLVVTPSRLFVTKYGEIQESNCGFSYLKDTLL